MKNDFPFTQSNMQQLYQQKLKTAPEAVAQFADELNFVTFGCYAATPVALSQAYAQAARTGLFKRVIDTYLFRSSAEVVAFFKDPEVLKKIHPLSAMEGQRPRRIVPGRRG